MLILVGAAGAGTFTPASALAGGLLLGVASVLLLALNGKIAGVSGVLHEAFAPSDDEIGWRAAFLGGLVAAGVVCMAVAPPAATVVGLEPLGRVVFAGLLVGLGTRMANGCTSGHGVCGLGRLSLRSLVAVLVFLSAAIATTTVMRHALGVVP